MCITMIDETIEAFVCVNVHFPVFAVDEDGKEEYSVGTIARCDG